MALCIACNCEHHESVCDAPYPDDAARCECQVCQCSDCTGE